MKFPIAIGIALFALIISLTAAAPPGRANEVFGYQVAIDVVYGTGAVIVDGETVERDLLLDIYTPSDPGDGAARPAVILVHGGAFHRGGRRLPPFREAGAVHSRMEDYARLLTPLGYVCLVVEYRLATENPVPETTLDAAGLRDLDDVITPAGLSRTNYARQGMGLPALAEDERILLWNAAMAAAEDVNRAVGFVRARARDLNVDPDRIAIGGHSAGGGTAMNTAFGLKAPVAAIFPLSPPEMLYELAQVVNVPDLPATLLIVSQNDVAVTLEAAPAMIRQFEAAGLDHSFAWVPGFHHFYPTGAVSLGGDGSRTSVGERLIEFLDARLK